MSESDRERDEGSKAMAYTVTCNIERCRKEIVVAGPPPQGIEAHIICSECQEKWRKERDTEQLRDEVREWIEWLELLELRWVYKVIMHTQGEEEDRHLTSIGCPSVADRKRRDARRQEEWEELLQEFNWKEDTLDSEPGPPHEEDDGDQGWSS
jgi:hypothetical protein